MKKHVFALVILSIAFATSVFANDRTQLPGADTARMKPVDWAEDRELPITSQQQVVVNANAIVILVEDGSNVVRLQGDPGFLQYIQVKEQDGQLSISTLKKAPKVKGYVWVPVKGLKTLRVGNHATVRSSTTLHTPQLDIELDGSCDLRLLTDGVINLIENEEIEFTYHKNTLRNVSRSPLQ